MATRRILDSMAVWSGRAPGALGEGPEDRPRMTAVLPTASKPTAVVVVCPGGAYSGRAEHERLPVAKWLESLGVGGIVLDYRVAPYRYPAALHDLQRTIRVIRHHAGEWNIDRSRIGVLGFSAGGHLAACAATLFDDGDPNATSPIDRFSSRPDALIACYAVLSFGPFTHVGSMENLLGSDPDDATRTELSLHNRVSERTPPTFLWSTADDAAVPVENSLMFAAALCQHGVPFALHVYPHGAHGAGIAQNPPLCRQWTSACETWLREIGFING
jgi:acetyl esterase/lipase